MFIGIGIGLNMMQAGGGAPGPAYDPDAEALFARFTTPPTVERKGVINTLIVALKTEGVWSKLDLLYVLAAADAQAARRNWKQDLYNATAVSGPVFTTDRGYAGDGTASYLDSGFQLGVSPGASAQNSSYLMSWTRTDLNSSGVDVGANNNSIAPRSAGSFSGRCMNNTVLGVVVASSAGMSSAARSGASDWRHSRNGALLQNNSQTSTTPTGFSLFVGGRNLSGVLANPSSRQISVVCAGSYLTESEDLALYNALLAYLTSVGAAP